MHCTWAWQRQSIDTALLLHKVLPFLEHWRRFSCRGDSAPEPLLQKEFIVSLKWPLNYVNTHLIWAQLLSFHISEGMLIYWLWMQIFNMSRNETEKIHIQILSPNSCSTSLSPTTNQCDQQSAHCYCGSPKFLVHCPSDIRILGEFFSPNLRKRGFSQMLS